jgi:TPR repeat protein
MSARSQSQPQAQPQPSHQQLLETTITQQIPLPSVPLQSTSYHPYSQPIMEPMEAVPSSSCLPPIVSGQDLFDKGFDYYDSPGVEKNVVVAMGYWLFASKLDNADAQYSLGVLYFSGEAGDLNYRKGFYLLEQAAAKGHAKAQYNLGIMYQNGTEVEKDQAKSFSYFLASANQGHTDAQYYLGNALRKGLGVPPNREMALHWLEKAALAGNEKAKKKLHKMLTGLKFVT